MSASASKKKRKELNEEGLTQLDIAMQREKEKKTKKLRNTGIFVLVAVACLAGILALLLYLQNRKYAPNYDVSKPVATVGDQSISVPVYNHFYNYTVNNMLNSYYAYFVKAGTPFSQQSLGDGTVEDLFIGSTNTNLEDVYNIYALAKEKGFELSDENKKTIKDELDHLDEEAESYGFSSVEKYLATAIGRGCTKDSYEEFLTVYLTYTSFFTKLQEEFKPTDEEITAKYDEDHDAFDYVTFTYTTVIAESEKNEDGTTAEPTQEAKDKAKKEAEDMKEKMPDSATTVTYQKANVVSNLNQEIADWLFNTERKVGDTEVFAKDEKNVNYITVRFDGRDDNDYHRVIASVVTISKDTGTVEEGQKTAEEKFNELFASVNSGMSEEDFTKKVSDLGYTASANAYTRSNTVEGLVDFLYNADRKEGDIQKLETDTVYYLVRYNSTEEDTYRSTLIKDTLWSDYITKLSTVNTIQIDKDQLKYANTDLTLRSSSSDS